MCHHTPFQEDLESKKREQDERKECEHEEEAVEMSADFDGTFEDVEEGEGQSEGMRHAVIAINQGAV